MTKQFEVIFLGRDRVEVTFEFESDELTSPIRRLEFRASGCSAFLEGLEKFRAQVMALEESVRRVADAAEFDRLIPQGADHVSILIREIVLRARDRFILPYTEIELCHCRAVPTAVVDRAILAGCHTTESVAKMTSAGTSCGTCRPDTERLIAFRLKPLN